MGLKVRHNGIITDLSGSEYDPGDLGTKRLKIRHSGGITSYGLATDPTATSYCGLKFVISGVTHYIGRKTSASESQSYTTQGSSTREGHATRSSTYYTQSEVTGTETYQSRTTYTYYDYTYTGHELKTGYRFSYTGRETNAVWVVAFGVSSSSYNYSGSSWTRTYTERWWTRNRASTNGATSGGYVSAQGAWGAGVAITRAASYMTTLVSNSRSTAATQSESGSFTNGYTSAAWAYVRGYRTSSAYEVTKTNTYGGTYATYSKMYTENGYVTGQGTETLSESVVTSYHDTRYQVVSPNVVRRVVTATYNNYTVNQSSWTENGPLGTLSCSLETASRTHVDGYWTYYLMGSESYSGATTTSRYYRSDSNYVITHETASRSYTQSYYRTLTNTTTVQSQVETTRQSDYTYQSEYTYQQTTSSSASTSSHNFV